MDAPAVDALWTPLVDGANPPETGAGPWFEALRYMAPEDVVAVVWGDLRDLRPWAVQGVLTLPTAARWQPFLDAFIRRFAGARDPGMHYCGAARVHFVFGPDTPAEYVAVARHHGHGVYSELSSVSAALTDAGARPVAWCITDAVTAFTDGACTLNGRPGARASFAALVTGCQFGAGTVVRGGVAPAEYAFIDEADPERGVCATARPAAPSNNRGELLGIIYALLALLRGRALGAVEIISDSNISVKTLREWLPTRLAKGTAHELKNFDLVMIAWRLLGALRAQAAEVVLTHTRSHQAAPPTRAPRRDHEVHYGNKMADAHASAALGSAAVEVIDAPPALRALARPRPD